MALAPAPEIVEVEDDGSGESEDKDLSLSYKEALDVCEKFGKLCITHSDAHGINPLLLQRHLWACLSDTGHIDWYVGFFSATYGCRHLKITMFVDYLHCWI